MGPMGELWSHIGITPSGALGVVIASVALYVMYVAVLAVWGPRLFSSSSTLILALLTVLGSLMARAMLGDFPTLSGAVVAASTLLLLESALGRLRRATRRGGRHRPRVVMVEGAFVSRAIRERVVTEADLLTRLRAAGVRKLSDASLVILESRGGLTVMRPGEQIDAPLLAGVVGREFVPDHLIRGHPGSATS